MRPERRFSPRGAAIRGALWITLIALLVTATALTLQYVGTAHLLEARQHALVDDEATALLDRYRSDGVAGVAGAIERQQQLPRINEFFYLLAAPDGEPIIGNLVAWPREVDKAGFHSLTTRVYSSATAPRQRRAEARAILLDDGYRLLVGSLSDESAGLRERYLTTLSWSLLPTGILGLLLGFWYSRRGLAFLDAAATTGDRFLAGRFDERLPVSGRGDEYDRLAVTINRSFDEVGRLIESLRAATDGLAHDLKTPLTRIKARLELAELEPTSQERLREMMAENRVDLDALLSLIEDALALARAEGTAASAFDRVALDGIVGEAIEMFEPLATAADVTLVADLAPVAVEGAPSLLAHAVTNLLDNAIKYAGRGGNVRVELGASGSGVRLAVIDDGPGIPEELRARALMRFSRLDASRTTAGSGIGLSIVAVAARVHGAELRLSDAKPGLRVELVFPPASGK